MFFIKIYIKECYINYYDRSIQMCGQYCILAPSIFCLYTLRLTLRVVIAASFKNIASLPNCVVLSLIITEIMMIIVTIVHRASGILFVFCLFSLISVVSAISHPKSGILLVGTAFLPSLVFPICSSSYS